MKIRKHLHIGMEGNQNRLKGGVELILDGFSSTARMSHQISDADDVKQLLFNPRCQVGVEKRTLQPIENERVHPALAPLLEVAVEQGLQLRCSPP